MKGWQILRIKIITSLIHINELIIFYPRLRKFYKQNIKKENPLILDVGSNKGQTIDFFLKNFSSCIIYGFEPNNELFLFLCEKYKGKPNVRLFNCGISNKRGKLLFNETVTNETSTFEQLNYDSEYLKLKSKVLGVTPETMIKKKYEVDVMTLSDFIKEKNIVNIDVIKIDTEGHEYKCLEGLFPLQNIKVDYIQLEQHNDDMYANKVSENTISSLLKEDNFGLYERIKHGFGNFDEVVYKYK